MSLRPNSRVEQRRRSYKVGVDGEEGRRRREDDLIEIRKNRRADNVGKKRRERRQSAQQEQHSNSNKTMDSLVAMVTGIYSDDPHLILEFTTAFRELLSIEQCPHIEEVISAGVVPHFVEFLTRHNFPQLQFEAAWALTNITSGTSEQTRFVVDHGAVPKLVQLLSSPSDDVREQALWGLGNIAADSPKFRDLVLSHGALMPLLAQLNEHANLLMLRQATWTLFIFFRAKPRPPFEQMKAALPALKCLIYSTDEEVLTYTCWTLSYLSDGTNDEIQAVIDAGVCHRLVELVLHPSPTVCDAALNTVGNIVTGDDEQTQAMISNQLLPHLLPLLTNNYTRRINKLACWTISNITAGNRGQIQAVIDANIIPSLMQLFQTAEFDTRKEAVWTIFNVTSCGSHKQIVHLVSQGCINPLCDLLDCNDPKIVRICLDGLENILKVGEAEKELGNSAGMNLYARFIDDVEGLEKIENLQHHDNYDIYEKAVKILQTYWQGDDEEYICLENDKADQYVAPNGTDDRMAFNFGGNQTGSSYGFTIG